MRKEGPWGGSADRTCGTVGLHLVLVLNEDSVFHDSKMSLRCSINIYYCGGHKGTGSDILQLRLFLLSSSIFFKLCFEIYLHFGTDLTFNC